MAHFAKIEGGVVTQVIVVGNQNILDAEGNESEEIGQAFITKIRLNGEWKQTSYNTSGGVHQLGDTPLRANFCGKGWQYDPDLDIFHPQQPYPSWTLDTVKGQWNPPVPYPEIGEGIPSRFNWNEEDQQWDEMEMPSE